MKLKPSVVLIFFVLLSYNCSNGDATPTSPEKLLTALSNAVNSDDKVKAETFFTKESWNARNDSGERFFKQAVMVCIESFKLQIMTALIKSFCRGGLNQ